MNVRRMEPADLVRVAELSAQLGYPVDAQALRDRFDAIAPDAHQALFVADHEGSVVGWIHVLPQVLLESDPYAEIGGLVVDANARRTGAGRALVAAAEAFALAEGFVRVRVRSNVARTEAHAFYPALGYARIKTQHNYEKRIDV